MLLWQMIFDKSSVPTLHIPENHEGLVADSDEKRRPEGETAVPKLERQIISIQQYLMKALSIMRTFSIIELPPTCRVTFDPCKNFAPLGFKPPRKLPETERWRTAHCSALYRLSLLALNFSRSPVINFSTATAQQLFCRLVMTKQLVLKLEDLLVR
jgi:hypothetical protein